MLIVLFKFVDQSKPVLRLLTSWKAQEGTMSYSPEEAFTRKIFRSSDAICFDVDSTVCRDEAIDELAIFANKEKEVMEM